MVWKVPENDFSVKLSKSGWQLCHEGWLYGKFSNYEHLSFRLRTIVLQSSPPPHLHSLKQLEINIQQTHITQKFETSKSKIGLMGGGRKLGRKEVE